MTTRVYCPDDLVFYKKISTGITVRINANAQIRGDIFQCPKCGKAVYSDFGEPY